MIANFPRCLGKLRHLGSRVSLMIKQFRFFFKRWKHSEKKQFPKAIRHYLVARTDQHPLEARTQARHNSARKCLELGKSYQCARLSLRSVQLWGPGSAWFSTCLFLLVLHSGRGAPTPRVSWGSRSSVRPFRRVAGFHPTLTMEESSPRYSGGPQNHKGICFQAQRQPCLIQPIRSKVTPSPASMLVHTLKPGALVPNRNSNTLQIIQALR